MGVTHRACILALLANIAVAPDPAPPTDDTTKPTPAPTTAPPTATPAPTLASMAPDASTPEPTTEPLTPTPTVPTPAPPTPVPPKPVPPTPSPTTADPTPPVEPATPAPTFAEADTPPSVVTATAGPVAAGATSIQVADITGLLPGSTLTIGDGVNSQTRTIVEVVASTDAPSTARRLDAQSGTVTFDTPLDQGYAPGSTVSVSTPAAANPANPAGVNDPSACTADLAGAVAAITGASNEIVQATVTCPPQEAGEDSSCADFIVGTFADFSLASQKLASASKTCAVNMATIKGATCGQDISSSIKALSVASQCITRSTDSCKDPSEGGDAFGCVVDVVDVVDALANGAGNVENAVKSCKAAETDDPQLAYLYDTWMQTGCTVVPTASWIRWGFMAATASNTQVFQEMYDWCQSATGDTTGQTPPVLHAWPGQEAAHMCCGKDIGNCDAACTLQTAFVGNKGASPTYEREEDASLHTWPKELE